MHEYSGSARVAEDRTIGASPHEVVVDDNKEVHFLNRLIRCGVHQGSSAIFLEPDRRRVDLLVQQLGVASAKGVETCEEVCGCADDGSQQSTSSEGHGTHVSVVCYASSTFGLM